MARGGKANRRGGRRHKKNKGKKAQGQAEGQTQRAPSAEQHAEAIDDVEDGGNVADVEDDGNDDDNNGGEGPSSAPMAGSILGGPIFASPEMMSPRTLAAFPRANRNDDVSDMDLTDPSSVDGVKLRKKREVKACADDTSDDESTDSSSSDSEDNDTEMPTKDTKGKGKAPADKGKQVNGRQQVNGNQVNGNGNGQSSKSKSNSKPRKDKVKAKRNKKENVPPSAPPHAVLDFGGPSTAGTAWSPSFKTPSPPPGLAGPADPMSSPIVIHSRASPSQDDVFAPGTGPSSQPPQCGSQSQRGGRNQRGGRAGSQHGNNRRRRREGTARLRDGPIRRQVVYQASAAARALPQFAEIDFAPPPLEDMAPGAFLNPRPAPAPPVPPAPPIPPRHPLRNNGTVNPAHLSIRPVPTVPTGPVPPGFASSSSASSSSSSQQGSTSNYSNVANDNTFPRDYNLTEVHPDGNLLIILVNDNTNNVLQKFLVLADNLGQLSVVWDGRLLDWRSEVIPLQAHESGMHAVAQHMYAQSGPSDVPFRDYLRHMLGDIFGRQIGDNNVLMQIVNNIASGQRQFPAFPFPVVHSECHRKADDRIYCCNNGRLNGFGLCTYHKYKLVYGKIAIDIGKWLDEGVSARDAIMAFRSIFGVTHDRDNIVPTPLSAAQLAAHLDLTARFHMGIIMRQVLQNRLDTFGVLERTYLNRDGPFAYHMRRHLIHYHQHGQHLEYRYVTHVRQMSLNANSLSKLTVYWLLCDRTAFELTLRRVAWQSYLVGDGRDANRDRLKVHLTLTDPVVDEGGRDGTRTNRITVPSGHVLYYHIGAVRKSFVWRLIHFANTAFAELWRHYKEDWPHNNNNNNKHDGSTIKYKCRAVGVTDEEKSWCDYAHLHALINHMLKLNPDYMGIPDPSIIMDNSNPDVQPPKFQDEVGLWRRAPHSLLEFIEDAIEAVHKSAMEYLYNYLDRDRGQDSKKHRACRGSLDDAVEAGFKFLFETRNFPQSALYPFTVLNSHMNNPMQQNRAALCQMEVPFDNIDTEDDGIPVGMSAGGGSDFPLPGEDDATVNATQDFLNEEFSAILTGLGINVANNEYDDGDDDRYMNTDGEGTDPDATEDEE